MEKSLNEIKLMTLSLFTTLGLTIMTLLNKFAAKSKIIFSDNYF